MTVRSVPVFVKSSLIRSHQVQVELRAGTLLRERSATAALRLQNGQVFRRYITGNVTPIETRGFILCNRWVDAAHIFNQGIKLLVHQVIGANFPAYFLVISSGGNEFVARGHINAINVGKPHGGCSRSKKHLVRAGFLCHLDNFAAGGAAHNRVIDQQYIFSAKLHAHGIELLADRFTTQLLARHDKGSSDVAVFYETFTKTYAQAVGKLQGTGTAGIRNRNDYIDIEMTHRGF